MNTTTEAIACIIGIFFIYVAVMPLSVHSVDGHSMASVTLSLITNHSFTVHQEVVVNEYVSTGIVAPDGNTYSPWYPLQSLLAVPFAAPGVWLATVLHRPPEEFVFFLVLLLPALLTAITVWLIYRLAMRFGSTRTMALLAASSYAFGSIALVYARSFFAEPLLALLTLASLAAALDNQSRLHMLVLVWCCMLAVLAKPTGVVVGGVVALYGGIRYRTILPIALPLGGTFLGIALYMLYNFVRFNTPFETGTTSSIGLWAMPEGIIGLLFSPGRGVVWYCPPVLLVLLAMPHIAQQPSLRLLSIAVTLMLLAYLCIYTAVQRPAHIQNWFGGWSWGPRFLLPALPPLYVLAALLPSRWHKLFVALSLLGVIMHLPTLIANYHHYYEYASIHGITQTQLLWSPLYSPLLQIWRTAGEQFTAYMHGSLADTPVRWLSIPISGISSWVGVGVMCGLLGMGSLLLLCVWYNKPT